MVKIPVNQEVSKLFKKLKFPPNLFELCFIILGEFLVFFLISLYPIPQNVLIKV